jgi:prepilin-type N-terminal cleavage/methylation domain-containing protein
MLKFKKEEKKQNECLKGFTLVELLVVLLVIGLVSSIVLISYRGSQRKLALTRSAYQLAQDIRRVQGMAMAAQEFEGNVPQGYGISINLTGPGGNNKQYALFADFGVGETVIETLEFEKGIEIKQIRLTESPNPPALRFKMTFFPPDPLVEIVRVLPLVGGDPTLGNEASITLRYKDDGPEKTINVNKAGLIEIQP